MKREVINLDGVMIVAKNGKVTIMVPSNWSGNDLVMFKRKYKEEIKGVKLRTSTSDL